MHQERPLLTPFWLIAASLAGIGDTLYLSYYHLLGLMPTCAIGGCEIVLSSKYASFLGVPLAYIGLVYYVYMLGVAILLVIDPRSLGLRLGAVAYTAIGLGLSIFFELFQYFVIGALCMYCAISALTTLALFLLALWHWRATR